MANMMIRRREALYTLAELSTLTGIPIARLRALEASFLSDDQRAYLTAVRYKLGLYPIRKRRKLPTNVEGNVVTP